MHHLVARSEARQRLWRTWAERLALFRRIVRGCPGLVALVVMPDHLHLLHRDDVRVPLARALSGDTRARRARDREAPQFAPMPPTEALVDEQKRRRAVRYVHLNPVARGCARIRSRGRCRPIATTSASRCRRS